MSLLSRCMLVLLGTCAWPVQGAVDMRDQTERYAIAGSTPAELRRELNLKRPRTADGRQFDGHTHWHVSWRYRYLKSGSGCAIASVNTSLKVTITLPEWRNEREADSGTRRLWSRYLAALELHEQGHRRHGVHAANEIDHAIAAIPTAVNCDGLGVAVNALGGNILRKYNQHDVDYDRDTKHGATQGARFP